ncbi:MAG: aldehyde dehydrogenase (NADP(+)) [Verrucomicrobiales bacterium]|nr:aldehyde dehydrogenase (NADP(+)) [Verrucomicrobiales bacterium]
MSLTGNHLIAGIETPATGTPFTARNPATGATLDGQFADATDEQVEAALQAAEAACDPLRLSSPETRAQLLDALADEILALGDALLDRAHAETALPMARLTGERGRAVHQCKMFAGLLREGSWLAPRIDTAIPDRQPLPKPDVRQVYSAIGPVVVFGASNFPFAIGVVGTDTVCALAAGCPVVVKGHPAHPGTCEMLGGAIARALEKVALPAGSFSLLQGAGHALGGALVRHPLTQAVGFTGSLKGGRALMDLAAARPSPIPVYAEMGSVNPVFLLPGALAERGSSIAEAYLQSVNMGVGQFCTNPAILLGLNGPGWDTFTQRTAELASGVAPATMLHQGIAEAYEGGTEAWKRLPGLQALGQSTTAADPAKTEVPCQIFTTSIDQIENQETLHREVFGPCSIVAPCSHRDELLRFAHSLEGQLTASIHGTPDDLADHADLIHILERKVGRIIFNGFGTGIEPCPSMHHGGPYPAASHSFFTSIGTASILRFVRPVCYQGFPDPQLPAALQNANPTGAMRLVNGTLTRDPIA